MLKKIKNVIMTVVTILVVLLACIFAAPKIFGITPMVVLSGSMEPTYPVGSLIFVDNNVDPTSITKGDNITFHMAGSTVVTHRIIEVNAEQKTFTTKGDANNVADSSPVSHSQVIGKAYDFAIPLLGYLAVFINSMPGYICIGTLIVAMIIMSFIESKSEQKG